MNRFWEWKKNLVDMLLLLINNGIGIQEETKNTILKSCNEWGNLKVKGVIMFKKHEMLYKLGDKDQFHQLGSDHKHQWWHKNLTFID